MTVQELLEKQKGTKSKPSAVGKSFVVDQGKLEMDAMDSTKSFVDSDIRYYHKYVQQFASQIDEGGPVSFVNQEKGWTIGVNYEESELGALAKANGQVVESGDCSLSAVFEKM